MAAPRRVAQILESSDMHLCRKRLWAIRLVNVRVRVKRIGSGWRLGTTGACEAKNCYCMVAGGVLS